MTEGNAETVRKLMKLEDDAPIDEDIDEAITEVVTMSTRAGRYLLAADVMAMIILRVLANREAMVLAGPGPSTPTADGKPPKKRPGRRKGSRNKAKAKEPVVLDPEPVLSYEAETPQEA